MADTRERMAKETGAPDLVLGTAGHIDHGKSSLVRALTGVDPDRLEEEKRRGITITLGFAQLALPDGRAVGVVDVPGHEKFVKHMIAGATGIDVALLVIAADDGVMPQTVEHVAVLQTLGITRCVVALTKIDLVDDEWRAFMKGEVEAWLANTAYAHAPVIEVSSKTGEGLDELKSALQAECDKAEHVKHGSLLRLPVDRVFTIKGAGTVVTGTLWSGTARPGDEIEILPEGARTRIRSVQMHNQPVEAAPAGNRVALNLNNVKTDEVHVGDMLCAPASIEPTDQIDVRLTYIDVAGTGKPLATGARMHVAHGTREVLGRVLLCDKVPQLAPGGSVYAQMCGRAHRRQLRRSLHRAHLLAGVGGGRRRDPARPSAPAHDAFGARTRTARRPARRRPAARLRAFGAAGGPSCFGGRRGAHDRLGRARGGARPRCGGRLPRDRGLRGQGNAPALLDQAAAAAVGVGD